MQQIFDLIQKRPAIGLVVVAIILGVGVWFGPDAAVWVVEALEGSGNG